MSASIITLPVRIGLRGAELAWDVTRAVAGYALDRAGDALAPTADAPGTTVAATANAPGTTVAPPRPAAGGSRPASGPKAPARPARPAADAVSPPVPPPPQPVRVSEEAELVESVAEAGAQDGAGAQIRVAEPWDGYRTLKAQDVIDRLVSASAAELAAVTLYEQTHRSRKTVLEAATRALARAQIQ